MSDKNYSLVMAFALLALPFILKLTKIIVKACVRFINSILQSAADEINS